MVFTHFGARSVMVIVIGERRLWYLAGLGVFHCFRLALVLVCRRKAQTPLKWLRRPTSCVCGPCGTDCDRDQ